MGTLSNWGAGANILKSLIGLGVLTLPYATKQVGWLASVVGFGVVAFMSVQGIFFAAMAREALEKCGSDDEETSLQSQGSGDTEAVAAAKYAKHMGIELVALRETRTSALVPISPTASATSDCSLSQPACLAPDVELDGLGRGTRAGGHEPALKAACDSGGSVETRVAMDTPTPSTAPTASGPSMPQPAREALGFFDNVIRRLMGWPMQLVCSVSIAASQLATVVCYVDTISVSMQSFILEGQRLKMLVVIGLVLISLSTVKTLTGVSYLSYAGLTTYMVVFLALVVQAAREAHDGTLGDDATAFRSSGSDFGTWFGISAFAFGGFAIGIIVYDDMKEPRHFYKVVSIAYSICWLFYTLFALCGYLCYGESTSEVIYFNFAEASVLRNTCMIAICIVLLLTYVVQMMPLYAWMESFSEGVLHYAIARGLIVVITLVIASFAKNLVVTMTVGGALSSSISAFILPPIAYLMVQPQADWKQYIAGISLVVLGILGAVKSMF